MLFKRPSLLTGYCHGKKPHKLPHCSVTQQDKIFPSYVMQKDKLNSYSTFLWT